MRPNRQAGFTLIEMMITVAIIGILSAVAFPAYNDSVRKGVRRAAQAQILDLANREQQFLISNRVYVPYTAASPAPSIVGSGYTLPAELVGKYEPSIAVAGGVNSLPSFTITFTAVGTQVKDGNLTYTSEGVRAPAGKW